jgi:hypothetical protein
MQAKFTQGSIFRHVNVMTLSGTVGLIALLHLVEFAFCIGLLCRSLRHSFYRHTVFNRGFKVEGLTADMVRWFCYGFSLIFSK